MTSSSLPSPTSPPSRGTFPEKYIAMSVDCNGGYCYLGPYEGGKIAVAEAARNLACSGAVPLGVTDNLNFGNPFNPELFWQLRECARGLSDACRAFNAPITGGNCSLYNQSPNGPIDPTPTVAMVGLIEKAECITTQWFKDEDDAIILLGDVVNENDPLQGLGGSAYLQVVHGRKTGTPPPLNLDEEMNLHRTLRALIVGGGIKSAHDCSEGGLAIALAECCVSRLDARHTPRLIGAMVDLTSALPKDGQPPRLDALLFGESQGRAIITCAALDATKVVERAKILGVPAAKIGTVGGDALRLKTPAAEIFAPVTELHGGWWNSIARMMK